MTEKSFYWANTAIGDGIYSSYDDDEFSDLWRIMFQRDRTIQSVIEDYANELLVSNPSGNTIRVATGAALVDGKLYFTDANVDNAIATPAVSTRNDRVVLRKSWANQTVRVAIITGVEGGGVPAITQTDGVTWEVPLATVQITTAPVITITDERQYSRTALAPNLGNSGLELIETIEVGAGGAATIDFQNIAADYTHLLMMGQVRGTQAAVEVTMDLRMNNDSGANYIEQYLEVDNTTPGGGAGSGTGMEIGLIPAASGTAGHAGGFQIVVPGYKDTQFYKNALAEIVHMYNNVAANWHTRLSSGIWQNTAAITRLTLVLSAGNFAQYSKVSLYGYA